VSSHRPRLLAVVSRFKWTHIDYLAALADHFEVFVAWSGTGGQGAPLAGLRAGMRGVPIGWIPDMGADAVRTRLQRVISTFRPDLVHVMYYHHEELTLLVRELVGEELPIVFECRDPITALGHASPADPAWTLERNAILAADRHIVLTAAQRAYYESAHHLDLSQSSLIIPHAFRASAAAPPSPKLSAVDGRTHIALVGTADATPDHGRWYGDIIRCLVDLGFVVHSHFWDLSDFGGSLQPYVALAEELDDYHHHPTVSFRRGTELSRVISRYDLMGVFHELHARHRNESAILAFGLTTKAVCGWFHGAIPVVCFPHYRGIVERIEEFGIGFVVGTWDELGAVRSDRGAIAAATDRCLACRSEFTTERAAERIASFLAPLHDREAAAR
jgi:Glycosyl transferase 4-like domain